MRVLGDQTALLVVCALLVLLGHSGDADAAAALAWLLVAVVVCGAHSLAETRSRPGGPLSAVARERGDRERAGGDRPDYRPAWAWAALLPSSAYLIVACVEPTALAGAPLAVYGIARSLAGARGPVRHRSRLAERLLALPAVVCLAVGLVRASELVADGLWAPTAPVLVPLAVALLAALLAVRTAQSEAALAGLHRVRDDLQDKVRDLSVSQARLRSAQEAENRAAVLDERTRIAREIHDGVGHQLTRLLFQVRALEVTHRDDKAMVGGLAAVGAGVGEALDSMRASVHALADDAEDLATALNVLAGRGPVEEVSVSCEVGPDLPAEVSRCLAAVVREALTNAARHGRARQARVSVVEYPGFWQAVVTNDGAPGAQVAVGSAPYAEGMGLRSMRERVEALGGRLHVSAAPRFRVLATVPRPGGAARAVVAETAPTPNPDTKEPR